MVSLLLLLLLKLVHGHRLHLYLCGQLRVGLTVAEDVLQTALGGTTPALLPAGNLFSAFLVRITHSRHQCPRLIEGMLDLLCQLLIGHLFCNQEGVPHKGQIFLGSKGLLSVLVEEKEVVSRHWGFGNTDLQPLKLSPQTGFAVWLYSYVPLRRRQRAFGLQAAGLGHQGLDLDAGDIAVSEKLEVDRSVGLFEVREAQLGQFNQTQSHFGQNLHRHLFLLFLRESKRVPV